MQRKNIHKSRQLLRQSSMRFSRLSTPRNTTWVHLSNSSPPKLVLTYKCVTLGLLIGRIAWIYGILVSSIQASWYWSLVPYRHQKSWLKRAMTNRRIGGLLVFLCMRCYMVWLSTTLPFSNQIYQLILISLHYFKASLPSLRKLWTKSLRI